MGKLTPIDPDEYTVIKIEDFIRVYGRAAERLLNEVRQQAAEEATRKERERCLECVETLKNKIWMPKVVPIEDGELDTIQGILDSQNKRVVELEKAVTASDTWNMALNQIKDKIKNG